MEKLRGKGHRVLLLLAIPTLIIESQNSESNQTLTTAMVCEKCKFISGSLTPTFPSPSPSIFNRFELSIEFEFELEFGLQVRRN